MRKVQIAEAVGKEIGVPPQSAVGLVASVIGAVKQILRTGETVKIPLFGNFSVREKRARVGRNPKTGEAAEISARRVVTFRPSLAFREAVNGAETPTEAQAEKQED